METFPVWLSCRCEYFVTHFYFIALNLFPYKCYATWTNQCVFGWSRL